MILSCYAVPCFFVLGMCVCVCKVFLGPCVFEIDKVDNACMSLIRDIRKPVLGPLSHPAADIDG